MLNFYKTIAGICIGFLLHGCGEYPCGRASSFIGLISYSDIESDTIILKRFSKGTNFTTLIDTVTLTRSNSNFQRNSDTLLILHSKIDITSDFDYEVFLTRVSKLYRITEIREERQSGNGHGAYCINPIKAYRLNGQLFSSDKRYDFIYLRK